MNSHFRFNKDFPNKGATAEMQLGERIHTWPLPSPQRALQIKLIPSDMNSCFSFKRSFDNCLNAMAEKAVDMYI